MPLYSYTWSERSMVLADRSLPAGSIRAVVLSFITSFPPYVTVYKEDSGPGERTPEAC